MISLIGLVLFCLFPVLSAAAEPATLDAEVDRTSMVESETLTLTLTGTVDLELSLDSLMNLRSLNLPEPELGDLRVSFDVLDARQSYSLRSINGEHSAEVTWTYALAPRKSGTLTIPEINFRGARSEPITIEVEPGQPGRTENRDTWVVAEVSKDQVYVQEKLIYTLRLYYLGSLVGGDLTEPTPDNAILEPLGEQRQSSEFINGKRYQVVERHYLLYPQNTGELTLPAQYFTGRQRDPATGALRFLRAQSDELTVEVLPPPADFQGDRWIPAESLVLDERWSREPDELQVGDSLTRVLTVRTLGLLESALPLLDNQYPEQFNVYPEGPESEAEINGDTVEASQTQTIALVAVKPGTATIPAIRLHWWDTLNDVARVAVIPERTLKIAAAPGASTAGPAAAPSTQGAAQDNPSDTGASDTGNAAATDAPDAVSPTELYSNPFNTWLTAAAVFFAFAWLVTLGFWWRQRAANAAPEDQPADVGKIRGPSLSTLKRHALEGRVEALMELPAWARHAFARPNIRTLGDTRAFFRDPVLDEAIDELERLHFGNGGEKHWRMGQTLADALERLSQGRGGQREQNSALPPFRKLPS